MHIYKACSYCFLLLYSAVFKMNILTVIKSVVLKKIKVNNN